MRTAIGNHFRRCVYMAAEAQQRCVWNELGNGWECVGGCAPGSLGTNAMMSIVFIVLLALVGGCPKSPGRTTIVQQRQRVRCSFGPSPARLGPGVVPGWCLDGVWAAQEYAAHDPARVV